jgi:hypothetical protein
MPHDLKQRFFASILIAAAIGLAPAAFAASPDADDDEPINLSPVKSGSLKPEDEKPTEIPTAVPAATAVVVVATPTAVPTPRPKPKPVKKLTRVDGLSFSQDDNGVHVVVQASGPLRHSVSRLKNPDRLLVSFPNATLPARQLSKEIGQGAAAKARLAQHPGDAVWLVLDLLEPVEYTASQNSAGFKISLQTGVADSAPASPRRIADLPKINLMFFDLNVLYQGKQYDRFPCANFIYDKSDSFPLKREFISTLVFHDGYGAFVGNLRVVDPKGKVIDHTKEPVAFNLFSELFDYSVELPWKLEFPAKGFYSLVLTLNGEDVLVHRFYVGHNDDKPNVKN